MEINGFLLGLSITALMLAYNALTHRTERYDDKFVRLWGFGIFALIGIIVMYFAFGGR